MSGNPICQNRIETIASLAVYAEVSIATLAVYTIIIIVVGCGRQYFQWVVSHKLQSLSALTPPDLDPVLRGVSACTFGEPTTRKFRDAKKRQTPLQNQAGAVDKNFQRVGKCMFKPLAFGSGSRSPLHKKEKQMHVHHKSTCGELTGLPICAPARHWDRAFPF